MKNYEVHHFGLLYSVFDIRHSVVRYSTFCGSIFVILLGQAETTYIFLA